jgi:hypothetical protein
MFTGGPCAEPNEPPIQGAVLLARGWLVGCRSDQPRVDFDWLFVRAEPDGQADSCDPRVKRNPSVFSAFF